MGSAVASNAMEKLESSRMAAGCWALEITEGVVVELSDENATVGSEYVGVTAPLLVMLGLV